MSLASRISNFLSPNGHTSSESAEDVRGSIAFGDGVQERRAGYFGVGSKKKKRNEQGFAEKGKTETRSPYLHCMLAGGMGGTTGDLLMHSVDTVKTRQQGDRHVPAKYTSMSSSYTTIFKEEGIRRGLYGGVTPAFLGSFPGTIIFFGMYEYSKRHLLDAGVHAPIAYLAGGFIADLAASVVYVPSEVLKTRLQLQGRYNNPFFKSGYNYRSTADAARTIIRKEGFSALFYGYRATIMRDLPFSALQFAFYEQGQTWAKQWCEGPNIGLPLELLTGAAAGGLAGVITCPLDVVKTRIQTQVNPHNNGEPPKSNTLAHQPKSSPSAGSPRRGLHPRSPSAPPTQTRHISTSSPSTSTCKPGSTSLDTSSILMGLRLLYRAEGIAGMFRGVGPRFVWTSVQSATMLVLYQYLLRELDRFWSAQPGRAEGHSVI